MEVLNKVSIYSLFHPFFLYLHYIILTHSVIIIKNYYKCLNSTLRINSLFATKNRVVFLLFFKNFTGFQNIKIVFNPSISRDLLHHCSEKPPFFRSSLEQFPNNTRTNAFPISLIPYPVRV